MSDRFKCIFNAELMMLSLHTVADISKTTGYELEVFRGHLVRAMTCPTLIIPVLYSMGITTAALGKEQLQYYNLISCSL